MRLFLENLFGYMSEGFWNFCINIFGAHVDWILDIKLALLDIFSWYIFNILSYQKISQNFPLFKYIKKSLAQVFSCEFWEISKNTFFTEHFQTTAIAKLQFARAWSSVFHSRVSINLATDLKDKISGKIYLDMIWQRTSAVASIFRRFVDIVT